MNKYLQRSLALAKQAAAAGEVPVGAVITLDDKIIGEGYNQPIHSQDPSAHAEMVAIREAAKALDNYRLLNTTLYVTLEPCAMCVGAILHARIKRLVFGALDPKAGAVTSVFQILDDPRLNHYVDWSRADDAFAAKSGQLLLDFFAKKRES